MKKDVIKGLGDLLQMFAPGMNAIYGVSVRVGPRGAATLARPRHVRRNVRQRAPREEGREPVVDVFDEGEVIVVVVQLPGVDEHAAEWTVRDRTHLTIRADSADRKYLKELDLPAPVDETAVASTFANGVLELKLWKRS